MKYDPSQPLYFLHVPRCGGTALVQAFLHWYGERLYVRDFISVLNGKPEPSLNAEPGSVVFGHFSKNVGGTIEEKHPSSRQFVTFVRDPFDILVSNYFYITQTKTNWTGKAKITQDLRGHIEEILSHGHHDYFFNYLPHRKPGQSVADYFRETFLFVGDFGRFQMSANVLAVILGRNPTFVKSRNAFEWNQEVPIDLKGPIREAFPDEFEFYDLATKIF